MHVHEVIRITTYIHDLYRDRFPPLSDGMARIWYEELRRWDTALAEQAVNRWARQHTIKAPSLDELIEQIEFTQEEQRRNRPHTTSHASVSEIITGTLDAALKNRADWGKRSDDEITLGKLMVCLLERSTDRWLDERGVWHDKLTLQQRAEQCYEWAKEYPRLMEPLQYQARTYAEQFWSNEEEHPC